MRCDQFESRLNDVLDRREDPRCDRLLTAHAKICPECREQAAAYAAMLDGLASLSPPVVRRAAMESPARTLDRRVVATLATLAAAWLVTLTIQRAPGPIAAGPAVQIASQVPTSPPAAATAVATPQLPPAPAIERAPVVVHFARQTGSAYLELIHDTTRGLDEALELAAALPPPSELLQPVLFSNDGLLRLWETDLAPMADETIDALRSVLPAAETPRS